MSTLTKIKKRLQEDPKNWLITGVAGFIGSNLLETLLDLDQIVDPDMWSLARLYLRARRMRKEIRELRENSRKRQQQKLEAWLASI